jgi:hypothetical protein
MWKQLASCFAFTFILVLVAAVTTITAQPDANVLQVQFTQDAELRLQKIEGDIEFLTRALAKLGAIERK